MCPPKRKTSTFQESLDDILELHKKELTWRTQSVSITVATSFENDAPVVINLIDTMEKGKNRPRKKTEDTVYWLPKKFCTNSEKFRTEVLAPHFVLPCKDAGFVVSMKGWEKDYNYAPITCQRYRTYNGGSKLCQDETKDVTNTMTSSMKNGGSITNAVDGDDDSTVNDSTYLPPLVDADDSDDSTVSDGSYNLQCQWSGLWQDL